MGHRCGCGGSSTSWSCCGYGGSSVLGHAMGVGLCHGARGSLVLWFRGSCRGVCVVGHRHCVMLWVWVAVDFIFVVVDRFSLVVVG